MKFRNSRTEALLQPFHFYKDSKTQPQFGFDTDINNIVRGMTSTLPVREALSQTIDEVKRFSPDMYENALFIKSEAENSFNRLPSNVREFFNNNPRKMLEFLSDSKNDAKAVELGLKYIDSVDKFQSDLINTISQTAEKSVQTAEKSVTLDKESSGG